MSQEKMTASGAPSAVLDAFFPAVVRVGALELRPMTLGHYLALARRNSAFTDEAGAKITMQDAALAAFILSMPTSEAMRLARSEEFEELLSEFCARIPVDQAAGLVSKVIAHIDSAFGTVVSGDRAERPLMGLAGA